MATSPNASRRPLPVGERVAKRDGGRVRALSVGLAHLIAPLVILLLAALPASAREEIRSFDLQLAVYETGNVFASETIALNAEGDMIKHGIYRDIELAPGQTIDVLTVKRDGRDEPYTFGPSGDYQRLRIGDANVLLEPGVHTYEINYVMTGAMSGPTLTWEATGAWTMPIMAATARVIIPGGKVIKRRSAYVSCTQCSGNRVTIDTTAAGVRFTTSGEIEPGVGLVISLGLANTPVKPPPVKRNN